MFEFHQQKAIYFEWQYLTARDYIIPFIEEKAKLPACLRVCEIGCGEAGVLKAFLEQGHYCTGIELDAGRIETAKSMLPDALASGQVQFICRNIYDIDPVKDLEAPFDLIILKDVIEHIPDQQRFMGVLKSFLAPGGMVFFAFPPWYMPFGGHQQICRSRLLGRLPYFHLLPQPLYKLALRAAGEDAHTIQELLELQDTGISIERFERILRHWQYGILNRKFFLINPIYQFKFGLQPREQVGPVAILPGLRNFLTTAVYYLVRP